MVPLFELGHCAVIFCGYPAEVVTLFDLVNDSGLSPALLYVLEHLGVKKLARAVEIERIRLRGEEWPGPGIRKIEYAGAAVPGDYVVGVLRSGTPTTSFICLKCRLRRISKVSTATGIPTSAGFKPYSFA